MNIQHNVFDTFKMYISPMYMLLPDSRFIADIHNLFYFSIILPFVVKCFTINFVPNYYMNNVI